MCLLTAKSKSLKKTATLGLDGAAGRPALDDLQLEETKERKPCEFQIETKVLGDLLNRACAVELGSKLRFRHGKAEILNAGEAIAGVSRNRLEVMGGGVAEFLVLNKPKSIQGPLIDRFLRGKVPGVLRQFRSLLKSEPDSPCCPKLSEELLAIVLHELHGGIAGDESSLGQSQKERTNGIDLHGTSVPDPIRVHVRQRHGHLRTVQFRIIRCRQHDTATSRKQFDSGLVPETTKATCQFLFRDRL